MDKIKQEIGTDLVSLEQQLTSLINDSFGEIHPPVPPAKDAYVAKLAEKNQKARKALKEKAQKRLQKSQLDFIQTKDSKHFHIDTSGGHDVPKPRPLSPGSKSRDKPISKGFKVSASRKGRYSTINDPLIKLGESFKNGFNLKHHSSELDRSPSNTADESNSPNPKTLKRSKSAGKSRESSKIYNDGFNTTGSSNLPKTPRPSLRQLGLESRVSKSAPNSPKTPKTESNRKLIRNRQAKDSPHIPAASPVPGLSPKLKSAAVTPKKFVPETRSQSRSSENDITKLCIKCILSHESAIKTKIPWDSIMCLFDATHRIIDGDITQLSKIRKKLMGRLIASGVKEKLCAGNFFIKYSGGTIRTLKDDKSLYDIMMQLRHGSNQGSLFLNLSE